MREYRYTVLLEPDPDEGVYTVTVPSLPGIVTQGATLEEAISMARDAISLHVRGLIEDGLPVPVESEPATTVVVKIAA
jgi:antitoxin HicB